MWRALGILLAIAGVVAVIWAAGWLLFSSGESTPPPVGTGEVTTVRTTP